MEKDGNFGLRRLESTGGARRRDGVISTELLSEPRCQMMPLLVQGPKARVSPAAHGGSFWAEGLGGGRPRGECRLTHVESLIMGVHLIQEGKSKFTNELNKRRVIARGKRRAWQ